jgi:hypothetical protein
MNSQNNVLSINETEPQYLIEPSNFILLSILTVGLYPVWWTYKAWRFFIQKEGSNANAAVRTVFNLFFLYQLLNRIKQFAKQQGYEDNFSPAVAFILVVVSTFAGLLPPPFFLLFLLEVVFLLPAVKAFNFAVQQSEGIESYINKSLNTRQTVLVVIGALFWLLILLGLFATVFQA